MSFRYNYKQTVEAKKKAESERGIKIEDSTRNIFHHLDKNGDGLLDAYELQSALVSEGILVPVDTVMTMFSHIDSSGDGFMSKDEMVKYLMKPLETNQKKLLKVFCSQ